MPPFPRSPTMRYRSPSIAPGGNAPRSNELDETRRPTEDGDFAGAGFGAEPISVGRCESEPETGCPHAGQNRPETGSSVSQRRQRVTMRRDRISANGGAPALSEPEAEARRDHQEIGFLVVVVAVLDGVERADVHPDPAGI